MRIIKKFKNGVYNLFFFMDFFLWFVCINKIRKNNSKDNKDYNWATGIYDVYVLRKLIKKNKPKKILELGPGIGVSSEAIIDEMSDECELIMVDHEQKCIQQANERVKNYNKSFNFIHSKVVLSKDKIGLETICFENLGIKNYEKIDMIICDGPAWYIDEKKKLITDITRGDLFNIFEKLKAGCIVVIDGSAITRKIIFRFCSNSISLLPIYGSWVFSIKKNPQLIDEKLKKLINWNYIKID